MISYISIIASILSIILSKHLFKKWFNPLSLYTVVWGGMTYLYGLRLLPYYEISSHAWILIVLSYLSFLMGTVIVFNARNVFFTYEKEAIWSENEFFLFHNDGKNLKILVLVLGLLGLFAALQHWYVLVKEYGSVAQVFIRAQRVYHMKNVGTESLGEIPYLWISSYISIFFAGIYLAFKNKLEMVVLLPIIGISLKSMATFTRSGILFGLLEIVIAFVLTKYILSNKNGSKNKKNKKIIIAAVLLAVLMVGSATVVKMARQTMDKSITGKSSSMSQFEGNVILSPAIYFYLSSQIVTFSSYLKTEDENHLPFEYTLFPLYRVLGKFNLVTRPNTHSFGYYTPTWSNTATYLRNLHSDFGYAGIILGPFLFGLLSSYFWIVLFYRKKLIYVVYLTFIMISIGMSFFTLQSQVTLWVSIVGSVFIIKYFKNSYFIPIISEVNVK